MCGVGGELDSGPGIREHDDGICDYCRLFDVCVFGFDGEEFSIFSWFRCKIVKLVGVDNFVKLCRDGVAVCE